MNSFNKKKRDFQFRILRVVLCMLSLSLFWACVTTESPEEPSEEPSKELIPMSFNWGGDVYIQTDDYYSADEYSFEKVGTWKGRNVYKRVGEVKKEQIGYYVDPVEDDLSVLYIKVEDKFLAYEREDFGSDI